MEVEETGVCKVVRERAYSSAWHPNDEKLLLAVGDKVWEYVLLYLTFFVFSLVVLHILAFCTLSLAVHMSAETNE